MCVAIFSTVSKTETEIFFLVLLRVCYLQPYQFRKCKSVVCVMIQLNYMTKVKSTSKVFQSICDSIYKPDATWKWWSCTRTWWDASKLFTYNILPWPTYYETMALNFEPYEDYWPGVSGKYFFLYNTVDIYKMFVQH